MAEALIWIKDNPKGLEFECGGTYEPGDGSLAERLTLVAIAAIDAEMKKLQAEGAYSEPIVSGDPRLMEKAGYTDRTDPLWDFFSF